MAEQYPPPPVNPGPPSGQPYGQPVPQYGQPQYGPPTTPYGQPYAQPTPPKKKSKAPLIIGIIAAVLLVICGGVVACSALLSDAIEDAGNTTLPNGNTGGGGGSGDEPATSVGLNQPARDGKFEFTVTAVQCGIASVGGEFLNEEAQGQFCKVSLTVKNIGTEAQMFFDANQYAFNAEGHKYEADSGAAIYLEEESNGFLENINPGNTVNGVILFDIPKDASIVKLELHDSAFSGGVTVTL